MERTSTEQTQPILLSVHDAAVALGVCERTVATLIAEDRLTSVKIGRRRLIPRHALVEWVAGRTNPTDRAEGRHHA